jgi:ribose transport system substrate-binding protein
MVKRLNPRNYPDYTKKSVIDRYMGRLDTHGVSRREFLSLASASAIAGATAASFGIPFAAVASGNGKMAHLMMTMRMEYTNNAQTGAEGAANAFGLSITSADGNFDSEQQLNQFEQQMAAGTSMP